MRSQVLIGLLAERERLRVVAALALGAGTLAEIADHTGLDRQSIGRVLRRLETAGLVTRDAQAFVLRSELFQQAARDEATREEPEDFGVSDPAQLSVLRAFVRNGRLTSIPVAAGKRQVVLEYIASAFEPGVRYPEKEVDALLRVWHPDHAALRRYLVDSRLLSREAGVYWRSGGWVDVAGPPAVREQRVAAYGLAEDGDRVLLVRLSRGAAEGRWTLPGGGLRWGERPVDALRREMAEETGLSVRVEALLDADTELLRFERRGERVETHHARILYQVTPTGGTLGVTEVGGSVCEVAWFDRGDLGGVELVDFAASALATRTLSGAGAGAGA